MNTKKRVKVVVTGAAGQIGYALAFRLASGQVFGPNVGIDLNLLEVEKALPGLEGVAMELEDCAFPLLQSVNTSADLKEGMNGIDWAILVGAAPRKEGMERADLLEINAGIFSKQGKAINEFAAENVRVFVVGNPCNTNCLIAMHNAPDVPQDHFFAMTMLDELRARAQLAKKSGTHVTAVNQMIIWGNHSATQYPDFYNAKINGKSAVDVIKDEKWLQNDFIRTVQQRGAQVIKARGASSAASAANAALTSVNKLYHDTLENEVFSVARISEGEYGVDKGLIFSFPCRTKGGEVAIIEGFTHNDFAKEKLRITLDELRSERDMVKEMGLI